MYSHDGVKVKYINVISNGRTNDSPTGAALRVATVGEFFVKIKKI